ncbi:hypothetical protein N6G02_05965 [Cupriavidus gilardii]|uniref:hypothetical protein n=2 Tax=Cupriavidus gilardii TaxID=82541 RepID=UPI0021BE1E06|nr:hypothetical protein [Cupriavidus gilardii]MCT9115667.1 hypothetical protein [Cupriavidus gilardii]
MRMKDKSSGIPNPVAPQSVESLKPEKGSLSQERRQNPAAEADTLPSESNPAGGGAQGQQGQGQQQGGKPGEKTGERSAEQSGKKTGPTPNEVMNEQVSPPDEQGDRMQSDRPHIGG